MDLGYVFGEVVLLYVKLLGVFIAYYFTMIYTAQNRSSKKPPLREQVTRYAACTGAVFVVACCSLAFGSADVECCAAAINRGAIVFLALIIPALLGTAAGFTRERLDRDVIPSYSEYD